MSVVVDVLARLRADVSDFRAGMQTAQSEMQSLSDGMQNAGRKISGAGRTMTTRATLPIIGLGTAAFKTAADFQGAMNQVQAVTGETAGSMNMQRMTEQAKELGATTVFSAKEAADGMGFLAMAGMDTQQVMEAIGPSLSLAAAGNMELAQAADIASNVMSGFGMNADQVGRISDVLANTAANANTNVTQMGEAMSYVAPIAASAGISLEEAAAVVGQLGNAGIQGSRAGTSLMQAINKLLNPSGAAADTIEKLGLNIYDAEGNITSMTDVVSELSRSSATTAEIMTIFGSRAGPAMAALVGQGVEGLEGLHDTLIDSAGAADTMAEVLMQGAPGAMARMRAATEALMIAVGDSGLLEAFTDVIETVGGFLSRLSETNPAMLRLGVIVLGVIAAVGPLLMIIGGAISGFGALIGVLGALFSPITLIVVAVAGLIAFLVNLYRTNEEFRDRVNAVWKKVKAFVMDAAVAIGAVVKRLVDNILKWWDENGEKVIESAIAIWDAVSSFIGTTLTAIMTTVRVVLDSIRAIWDTWGEPFLAAVSRVWRFIAEVVAAVWDNISGIIQAALSVIQGIWMVFSGLFTGDWSRLWDGIKTIFSGVWDAIKNIFGAAWDVLFALLRVGKDIIVGLWKKMWEGIKSLANRAWEALIDAIDRGVNAIYDFFVELPGRIIGFITGLPDMLRRKGKEGMDSMKSGVDNGWTNLKVWFRELPARIGTFFSGAGSWLFNAGKAVITGLWNGVKSMEGWFREKATDLARALIPDPIERALGMRSPSKVMAERGRWAMEGLAIGLDDGVGNVVSQMTSVASAIGGAALPSPTVMPMGEAGGGTTTVTNNYNVTVNTPSDRANDVAGATMTELYELSLMTSVR